MGIKKINRPAQNWWERVYIFELARGLFITGRELVLTWFKPGYMPTYQYPEDKRPVEARFRGRHRLRRRADGTPVCVACYACQTICPVQTIDIVAEESPDPKIEKRPKEFSINMLRCIYCGMCVEACPKDAIYMTQDYEFANQTRDQMIFRINDLLDPLPGEECPKASKDGKKKE